ncbi:hypothetical protein WSK_3190 [Novosphingobium sp. Rr 2-17]|uniref:hypothetical protein n=1 Tax=Novosphingobium sp. Rr 2-17 TaxID=555793 RepID=UPI0002698573|nr:hypothetical protein [Novosphingobium sp. Rr 2-17]EIZ78215.1 hypothetical protein WSK_3190 [Novosphingobium sp. Rr 2-17]
MPAFYLTLVAVLLAGIGARDQMTIAGLTSRQGRRPGVLLVALLSTVLTGAAAAFAARFMLIELPPPARAIFGAFALGTAGIESMVFVARRSPKEPTNSLGALLIVLLAQQITDAARFILFGLGVALAAPGMAGAAGVAGGSVLVAFAWARPELLQTPAARWTRRGVGVALTLAAIVLLLRQFGIV